MTGRDSLRALGVAIVWGINFAVIGKGLEDLPPLLFVALRFLLTAFPVIFVSCILTNCAAGLAHH